MIRICFLQFSNLFLVVLVVSSLVKVEGFLLLYNHRHDASTLLLLRRRILSRYDNNNINNDHHWRFTQHSPLSLFAETNNNNNEDDDDNKKKYNVEAALVQLMWEGLEASASRPILNLSERDASPEEDDDDDDSTTVSSTVDWDQGQFWEETKQGLENRGLTMTTNNLEDTFLEKCPQLLRLSPTMVLESADLILEGYGMEYLIKEPKLLLYKSSQIRYGLEFMSTMMMMDATAACKASSALLISGIDGGIQEQAVQSALSAAGSATSQANQKIAGDAMAALQSLKNKNQRGLS